MRKSVTVIGGEVWSRRSVTYNGNKLASDGPELGEVPGRSHPANSRAKPHADADDSLADAPGEFREQSYSGRTFERSVRTRTR